MWITPARNYIAKEMKIDVIQKARAGVGTALHPITSERKHNWESESTYLLVLLSETNSKNSVSCPAISRVPPVGPCMSLDLGT
jgi:hypothetical protein